MSRRSSRRRPPPHPGTTTPAEPSPGPQPAAPRRDHKLAIFAAVCAACALVAGASWAVSALLRGPQSAPPAAGAAELGAIAGSSHLVFLHTTDGGEYSRIAVSRLDDPDGSRRLTDMQCKRVYFAAGRGLCLGADRLAGIAAGYGGYTFDGSFQLLNTFQQSGLPSRVRVSPDGRYGAVTTFVSGHSYTTGFSTQTTLIDLRRGTPIANLEGFTVLRNGSPFQLANPNLWGVTFTSDSDRFYATVSTTDAPDPTQAVRTYLVEGEVGSRRLRILRENAECPSISPDNHRLVFKKRLAPGTGGWRLYVLDLQTMAESPVGAETRSVDDQVAWLDGDHILYGLRETSNIALNIWAAPLSGGAAQLLIPNAYSPAVVRD